MSQPTDYDAVIIGAGQGGMPLARALAEADWRVALLERRYIGGTCINDGCTPTKTMVASAKVAYQARNSERYGVETGAVRVHLDQVIERKEEVVHSFRSSNETRLKSDPNIDVLMGEASFTKPGQLRIRMNEGGERLITSEVIVLNVGARPRIPQLHGLEEVNYLTSTDLLDLRKLPEHLLVIGGGYIGVEFAQMYRRFGSKVTLVQRGPQLLPREDQDIADAVAEILVADGINVLLETTPVSVATVAENRIQMSLDGVAKSTTVTGSDLLLAAGRIPNTDSLQAEAAGLELTSSGHLTVDDQLRTDVPGVYGMGDAKGGPAFTHISYDDFRVLRAQLIENQASSIAKRMVPYTVFMDPQLGRIGLTEKEARKRDLDIRVASQPMDYVARAIEMDETLGLMKAIVDSGSDQILGAAVLGIEGGEIMSALQIAMMGKLPYTALKDATFAHPTLMESLNNLFSTVE